MAHFLSLFRLSDFLYENPDDYQRANESSNGIDRKAKVWINDIRKNITSK
jgi:hypothetical protein